MSSNSDNNDEEKQIDKLITDSQTGNSLNKNNTNDNNIEDLLSESDFNLILKSYLLEEESIKKNTPSSVLITPPSSNKKIDNSSYSNASTNIKTNIKRKPQSNDKKQLYVNFQLCSQNQFEIKPNFTFPNVIIRFFRKNYGSYYQMVNTWSFNMINHKTIQEFFATSMLCKDYLISFIPPLTLKCLREPDTPNLIEYSTKENKLIKVDYSKDIIPLIDNLPKELIDSLYPFQKEGIQFGIKKHCRFLLADEMGIGKTLQAICLSLLYKNDWPVLVVCPSPLVFIWRDELNKWAKSISYQIIQSSKDIFCKGVDFFIISYDITTRITDKLNKMNFTFVIVDEGHFLRNMSNQRSKFLIPYLSKAKRVIALTGTPLFNNPLDIFSLLRALRPDMFKSSKPFLNRYCYKNQIYSKSAYQGAANKKEFDYILSKIMIRRLKEDVLKDLPPKHRQKIEIIPSKEHLNQIKILIKKTLEKKEFDFNELNAFNDNEEISEFQETSDIISKTDLSSAFLCFNKAFSLTGLSKIKGINDYIGCLIESKCPFIIYAHHIQVLDEIEKFIKLNYVNYIRLDGYSPINQRQEKIKRFQTESNCLIALLSFTAFSLGISLAKASTVVFAELHFSFALMLQAEDRVHRIGQKKSVNIHYLYAKGTVDELLLAQIKENYFFMTQTLNKKKTELITKTEKKQQSNKETVNISSSPVRTNKSIEDYFIPIRNKIDTSMINLHSTITFNHVNETKIQDYIMNDESIDEDKTYEKSLKLNNFI